uniref:SWIM-type domain-containing protein n=1 Tax=Lygus hesperus TaxID=30085 RepID=A0A0K8T5N3_LYGHE
MQSDLPERVLGGPFTYFNLLKTICSEISQTQEGISDHHISVLYQLFGKALPKALDLIDKEEIEYITVESRRSYFIIRRPKATYYVYSTVLFCNCPYFQFNVLKKKKNLMCKHIIACHVALATKKCRFHSSPEYMSPDVLKNGETV